MKFTHAIKKAAALLLIIAALTLTLSSCGDPLKKYEEDTSTEEKDVYYVEHLSFRMDVKIFFKTIAVVLKHEGVSSATSVTMEEFKGAPEKETTSVGEIRQ